ncbi:MAG: hypothetical protein KAW03_01725 [Candidatus Lokiarchaeota archaeon]|nr:hypothetical protein [Candidatus Lokiarchaeota archaeon]
MKFRKNNKKKIKKKNNLDKILDTLESFNKSFAEFSSNTLETINKSIKEISTNATLLNKNYNSHTAKANQIIKKTIAEMKSASINLRSAEENTKSIKKELKIDGNNSSDIYFELPN